MQYHQYHRNFHVTNFLIYSTLTTILCIITHGTTYIYSLVVLMVLVVPQKHSFLYFEKLELRNLISRVPDSVPWTWTLTDQGKEVLIENLPKGDFEK